MTGLTTFFSSGSTAAPGVEPAAWAYEPSPGYENAPGGGSSWQKIIDVIGGIAKIAEPLMGAAGTILDARSAYRRTETEAVYLDIEAAQAEMNQRLALDEAELYELQGDTIRTQALIEREQTRDKWLKRYATAKAKYAASGVDVGEGSPVAVLGSYLEEWEQEERYIDIDEKNRIFGEVTIPRTQARAKASRYGMKAQLKRSQIPLVKEAGRESLLGSAITFGRKLSEAY